ncbi:hypothetical protein SALBM135S_02236 [Streptomyces alboniger]
MTPRRTARPRTSRKFDGVNRLSRFVLKADGTLDNASESKKVLHVPASRVLLSRRR